MRAKMLRRLRDVPSFVVKRTTGRQVRSKADKRLTPAEMVRAELGRTYTSVRV